MALIIFYIVNQSTFSNVWRYFQNLVGDVIYSVSIANFNDAVST